MGKNENSSLSEKEQETLKKLTEDYLSKLTKEERTLLEKGRDLADKKYDELSDKITTIEHTNAVLEDKVKQYEDPAKAHNIIRRGAIKKSLKFQANDVKCSPVDGHIIEPIVTESAKVKQ